LFSQDLSQTSRQAEFITTYVDCLKISQPPGILQETFIIAR
jgi:hypothetical protein